MSKKIIFALCSILISTVAFAENPKLVPSASLSMDDIVWKKRVAKLGHLSVVKIPACKGGVELLLDEISNPISKEASFLGFTVNTSREKTFWIVQNVRSSAPPDDSSFELGGTIYCHKFPFPTLALKNGKVIATFRGKELTTDQKQPDVKSNGQSNR